jgi:hypothetical protein
LSLIKEAFRTESLNFLNEAIRNGKRIITGEAIHPIATYHPNHWVEVRRYIESYLQKAAPSLKGKGVLVNHEGKPLEDCVVTDAYWDKEKSALIYKAEITAAVARMIESSDIQHVSVGIKWDRPGGGLLVMEDGGILPYGYDFDHLALVTSNYQAGDPLSTVSLWECLFESIKKANINGWVYDEKQKGWVIP